MPAATRALRPEAAWLPLLAYGVRGGFRFSADKEKQDENALRQNVR